MARDMRELERLMDLCDKRYISPGELVTFVVELVLTPENLDDVMRALPPEVADDLGQWLWDPTFGDVPILKAGTHPTETPIPEEARAAAAKWRSRPETAPPRVEKLLRDLEDGLITSNDVLCTIIARLLHPGTLHDIMNALPSPLRADLGARLEREDFFETPLMWSSGSTTQVPLRAKGAARMWKRRERSA